MSPFDVSFQEDMLQLSESFFLPPLFHLISQSAQQFRIHYQIKFETMKTVILASILAGAAAFAPASQKASSTALKSAFEDELGVQPPLGFFDPLGMLSGDDEATFNRLRYVEIKHGRIAQLAFLGCKSKLSYLSQASYCRIVDI
jgi:hypothetical protein